MIFITDIHGDHLHLKTLQELNTDNVFFAVPGAVMDKLPDEMKRNIMDVPNFDGGSFAGIEFQALPMYNLPERADSRHPKGRGNGYLLFIANKKIYISGDTEDILGMRTLSRVDVAFVCMNLPYTMNVEQAASAVNAFKPGIVYPYHYRGKGGLSDVEKFRNQGNAVSPEVEVRLRNWYSE